MSVKVLELDIGVLRVN